MECNTSSARRRKAEMWTFIDNSTTQEVREEKFSETNPLRLIARSNSKFFKQIEGKEKSSSIGVDDRRNLEYEHKEKRNRTKV